MTHEALECFLDRASSDPILDLVDRSGRSLAGRTLLGPASQYASHEASSVTRNWGSVHPAPFFVQLRRRRAAFCWDSAFMTVPPTCPIL